MQTPLKAILLLALFSVAAAAPGGYTLTGGVYQFDPDKELDYMEQARSAGKFAWSKKLAEEEQIGDDVVRGTRNAAPYIPTFFTQSDKSKAQKRQDDTAVTVQKDSPETFSAPIYYQK